MQQLQNINATQYTIALLLLPLQHTNAASAAYPCKYCLPLIAAPLTTLRDINAIIAAPVQPLLHTNASIAKPIQPLMDKTILGGGGGNQ
jgi:hypothetical protein